MYSRSIKGDMAKTAQTEPNSRTSLNLPPSVVEDAKVIALRNHTNISHVVADFLRQYIKDHARGKK